MRTIQLPGRGLAINVITKLMTVSITGERKEYEVETREAPTNLPSDTLYYFFHDVLEIPDLNTGEEFGAVTFSNDKALNRSETTVLCGKRCAVDSDEIPAHYRELIGPDPDFTHIVEVFCPNCDRPHGFIESGGSKPEVLIVNEVEGSVRRDQRMSAFAIFLSSGMQNTGPFCDSDTEEERPDHRP